MSRMASRRGWAVGDILLVLSALALVFGLAYPRLRRSALREDVEQVVVQVETVVAAAERFHREQNRWPQATGPGETPIELAAYLPAGFSFDQDGYQLDLDVWETAEAAPPGELPEPSRTQQTEALPEPTRTVRPGELPQAARTGQPEEPPDTTNAPPTTLYGSLAGVTVHADRPQILASLLDHFGGRRSFLNARSWTLVFASVPAR